MNTCKANALPASPRSYKPIDRLQARSDLRVVPETHAFLPLGTSAEPTTASSRGVRSPGGSWGGGKNGTQSVDQLQVTFFGEWFPH